MINIARYTVSAAIAALLAGCGVSQPPIGATVSTLARQSVRPGKTSDLLYVSGKSELLIYTFPGLKLVQSVKNTWAPYAPATLCSDKDGDVYLAAESSFSASTIYEFHHGGTSPFRSLNDPGLAGQCSVDPITGDLAVANMLTSEKSSPTDGDVVVYRHAHGVAKAYADHDVFSFNYCAYDNTGNLFADGPLNTNIIDELPKGGRGLSEVSLGETIYPSAIQWDGNELAIASGCCGPHGAIPVYQVHISGLEGTVSGPTLLESRKDRRELSLPLWIQNGFIVGPDRGRREDGNVYLWAYPAGGKPIKSVHPARVSIFGVTVSDGP